MPSKDQSDPVPGALPTDEEAVPPALPEPEQGTSELSAGLGSSRKPAIIAGIVTLVILAVLIGFGVYLGFHPPLAAVLRDIFIIFLGVVMMIIGLLMVIAVVAIIYVALKMYDLTQFVENELRPVLRRADDAVRTVHSRTVFISDTAVKPVIEVMSYASAVKSIIQSFTRPRK
jgi:hypothetical protein